MRRAAFPQVETRHRPIASPWEGAARRISVSEPVLLGRESEYVMDCLARSRLSMGEYTRRFELAFAEWIGVEHAVSCASGSAALHLALLGLGVGPGDAVLVPALHVAFEMARVTGLRRFDVTGAAVNGVEVN